MCSTSVDVDIKDTHYFVSVFYGLSTGHTISLSLYKILLTSYGAYVDAKDFEV